MPTSRAVLVLGMHRSGTSAIARGLEALSVDLGNDFLDAQPENPTGYWEDRGIVAINERLLKVLGMTWDDASLFERRRFGRWRVRGLQREAVRYLNRTFTPRPLWGFKDPRTIRVLPFWRSALSTCGAEDSYVMVIRNPRSVAASLYARQAMDADEAYRLWLAHTVPFLGELKGKPLVVVDYDLLMRDPRSQLERIGRRLRIPSDPRRREVDGFIADFLDVALRHSSFQPGDLEERNEVARATRDAYLLLYELAEDRLDPRAASFWSTWERIATGLAALPPSGRTGGRSSGVLARWLSRR